MPDYSEELPEYSFSRPLSAQQMRFVEEYVKDPTSAAAAGRRAGYTSSSASTVCARLLRDPRVMKMIDEATAYATKQLGITKERILQELALIAFASTKGMIKKDEDGDDVVDSGVLNSNHGAPLELSVTSVKGSRGVVKNIQYKTVRVADKTAALNLLGKHLNMFKDQVEVTGKMSLLDMIENSYKPPEIEDQSDIVDSTAVEVQA